MMLVPSMVQIAGAPLSCCERISELPSPLKSAASAICQVGPGLGRAAPRLRLVPSMIQNVGVPLSCCHRCRTCRRRLMETGLDQAGRASRLDHCPGNGNTDCPVAVQVLMETGLE